jgi:hypothetical protein
MGDFLESATRESPGSSLIEQVAPLHEQYLLMRSMLKPHARYNGKRKILGLHWGNHEERLYKFAEFDLMGLLSVDVECPCFHQTALQVLYVGDQVYRLFSWHGTTGARTIHGKFLALEREAKFVAADAYVMGHVHDIQINRRPVRTCSDDGIFCEQKVMYGLTGHYIGWDGGYAEGGGYEPTNLGALWIRLDANKHECTMEW